MTHIFPQILKYRIRINGVSDVSPILRCFNLDTMDLKICCKKHLVLLIVGLARICSILFLKFLDFPLTQGKMKIMLVILVQIRGVSEGFPIFGKIFREPIGAKKIKNQIDQMKQNPQSGDSNWSLEARITGGASFILSF